jgi:hypothetical protein
MDDAHDEALADGVMAALRRVIPPVGVKTRADPGVL